MQVYGLVGQTEKGIWPEAQLFRFLSIAILKKVRIFYFAIYFVCLRVVPIAKRFCSFVTVRQRYFITEKEMIDSTHNQIQASFYRGAHVREQARLSFHQHPDLAFLMLFNNYI